MMKIRNRILLLLLTAAMLFGLAACNSGNTAILFAVDIEDGTVVTESEFAFRASATCEKGACALRVTCNGAVAENDGEGNYVVYLNKGENVIAVHASSGNKTETRTFAVAYRTDFAITTDIDDAVIKNDVLAFTASATLNEQPCAVVVTDNGKEVIEKDEKYTVTLAEKTKHEILITARRGNNSETVTRMVMYDGFTVITTLKDTDTVEDTVTFSFVAQYGNAECDKTVTVDGKEITPNGSRYGLTLAAGENHILLTAKHGNATKEWSYTVRYVNAAPTITAGITDGQICRGSVFNFDVVAKDGLGKKLSASQISFSIDWNAEDGADSYVDATGISGIWDDDTMTSFRIGFGNSAFSFHAGTPFRLKITATDAFGKTAEVVRTMTYVPAAPGEKIGEVVFAMEGFSIGCGYFMEPIRIPVYEGVPFAKTLTDMLTDRGLTYTYTGEIEKGFYLASVTGLNLTGNRIADGIWDFVKDRGYSRSIPTGASLGEFDFGSGSGWMYSVNGVYKNYGFSDYYPQDGDTVRVQFTVILGEDLGGGGALGGGHGNSLLGDNPDYAPIMKLLAEIAKDPSVDKTVYREVIAAVSEWNLSQKAMDEQIRKLKTAYGTKE